MEKISAVILSGGKSTRMGRDKAQLQLNGETLLARIKRNLTGAGEILLSVDERKACREEDMRQIVDRYSGCGPLAGLHAALQECKYPIVFAVACDMPFVTFQLAKDLYPYLTKDIDAVIPVSRDGRKQVLGGLYRKELQKPLEECLASGKCRVRDFLDTVRVHYVPLENMQGREDMLTNLNTQDQYHQVSGEVCAPVFSIVAYSGTGKTTFLEKLIPELKKKGLRVAVVKHDAHDLDIDKEGKDSYRITQAGADVTGLISGERAVLMENRSVAVEDVLKKIKDVDVILTEGFKNGKWPKIMLYRQAAKKPVPLNPELCLAVVSDVEITGCKNNYDMNDAKGVAELIVKQLEEE